MIRYCGCVPHLFPRGPTMSVCNYTGLECISTYPSILYEHNNITCYPDCDETTYNFYHNFPDTQNTVSPILRVNLLPGPTLRYRRYVVNSKLDLVGNFRLKKKKNSRLNISLLITRIFIECNLKNS